MKEEINDSQVELGVYLLKHPLGRGYRNYYQCVVIAANEDEARRIHPSGSNNDWGRITWLQLNEVHLLEVERIGTADKGKLPGTVITSDYSYRGQKDEDKY